MKSLKLLGIAALAMLVIVAGLYWNRQDRAPSDAPDRAADIVQVSRQILEALRARDGDGLAAWVHPTKGVRFSPYAYVDVQRDRVFSREQIRGFWDDRTVHLWGYQDASGEPIALTAAQYCERFVLDRNYLEATSINVNADRAHGNTVNNAGEVYPQGTRVEYYIEPPPGEDAAEFGWSALRVVFENLDGRWFLIAIIHDQWTT